MAIRLRKVPSKITKCGWEWVALCAAEHPAQPGDVYLNDPQAYALGVKYDADRRAEVAR